MALLDRNGYGRSIVQDKMDCCYICGSRGCKLDRHEVFFGSAYRKKSKELGLWVMLCHDQHHIYGDYAAHNNRHVDLLLKRNAQRAAMEFYGWTIEEFIARFGRNYLEEE